MGGQTKQTGDNNQRERRKEMVLCGCPGSPGSPRCYERKWKDQ